MNKSRVTFSINLSFKKIGSLQDFVLGQWLDDDSTNLENIRRGMGLGRKNQIVLYILSLKSVSRRIR